MPADRPKRIAILGFSLETNRFSPICGEKEFRERGLFYGEAISEDARRPAPVINGGICGFYQVMDANGPWEPVPIVFAAAHPNGPADQKFFDHLLETMRDGLEKAGKLDGVYCCEHGAGLSSVAITGTSGPTAPRARAKTSPSGSSFSLDSPAPCSQQ